MGAREESINIYAKGRCRWIGCFIESKIKQWSYEGLKLLGAPTPTSKEKCLHGPNSEERDKNLFDGGVGALSKILGAYMGEVMWPVESTRGWKARPPRASTQRHTQRGGIVAKYPSGCCSVALAT